MNDDTIFVDNLAATATATSAQLRIMLVGDWLASDYAAASEELRQSTNFNAAVTVDAACELLRADDEPPELIFVAQHLPADYTQAEVDRMQAMAPLARIVVVAGTWCEGELRTGTPPVGVIRLYWYELAPWWQAAARRHRAGQCPLWSQPLNQPLAVRWSPNGNDVRAPAACHALIDAIDLNAYNTLSASLAAYDIDTTWSRNLDGQAVTKPTYTAGIWDGGQLSESEKAQLATFCQGIEGPVVTLLDFPRREHLGMVKQLGASAVLGKPYVVEELVTALIA